MTPRGLAARKEIPSCHELLTIDRRGGRRRYKARKLLRLIRSIIVSTECGYPYYRFLMLIDFIRNWRGARSVALF